MFRPAVLSSRFPTFDEKSMIDGLVDDLVAGGTDLRGISLDEMKEHLASALRSRPPEGLGVRGRWSCPPPDVSSRTKLC